MNCLHGLIEAQALRTPEADAAAFEGERLGYRELERRANRLAAHLVRLGAGPEARVGLFVERSLEMLVGILGVLKAGAAYVPMDPAFPQERLAFMLSDAGARIVLTQTRLARCRIRRLERFPRLRIHPLPINKKLILSHVVILIRVHPRKSAAKDQPLLF